MKHSVIFIALATVMVKIVDTNAFGISNTVPTKVYDLGNGHTVSCKIRSRKDACWFDHQIEACDTDGEMVKCVPCKPGYRNCVRSTSDFDVRCYRPEQDCQPEEILVVTELVDGGCSTKCICNKTAGYIRQGSECVQHPTPCGINSTLQDGMCTGCPAGTYKPWEGFQDCIPVPKPEKPVAISPSTQKPKNHSGFENETGVTNLQPPKHLTAKAISSSVLFFQWYKPGPVFKYMMFLTDFDTYQKEVNVTGSDDVMNVTVMDLKPSTKYTAYVTAINNHGASAKSETVHVATMNNDLELEAKEDLEKSGNGVGTDNAVIAGVSVVSVSVVLIIVFVLVLIYLKNRGTPIPSTNVIYNVINQYVIGSGSHGQQIPSDPPPRYYPRFEENQNPNADDDAGSSNRPNNPAPANSVVTVDTDPPNPLGQSPSLNSSSLLGGQHQSRRRTSLGADSVTPKEIMCDASVPGDAASQTSRKVPFPRQGKEEETALLQEGGSCSEFGPQAMTGTK